MKKNKKKKLPYCKSGFKGQCCCNCIYQKKAMRHPQNLLHFNGSIKNTLGFLCTFQHPDGSNEGEFVFFNQRHGMCEEHQFKKPSISEVRKNIKDILSVLKNTDKDTKKYIKLLLQLKKSRKTLNDLYNNFIISEK